MRKMNEMEKNENNTIGQNVEVKLEKSTQSSLILVGIAEEGERRQSETNETTTPSSSSSPPTQPSGQKKRNNEKRNPTPHIHFVCVSLSLLKTP